MRNLGQRTSLFCVVLLFFGMAVQAQQSQLASGAPDAPSVGSPAPSGVPSAQLVKFSGTLNDASGQPLAGVVGVTFAVYKDQTGGTPLWLETQNAQLDAQGNYTVLLGSTTSQGMPLNLFTTGETRWVGVQAQLPGL